MALGKAQPHSHGYCSIGHSTQEMDTSRGTEDSAAQPHVESHPATRKDGMWAFPTMEACTPRAPVESEPGAPRHTGAGRPTGAGPRLARSLGSSTAPETTRASCIRPSQARREEFGCFHQKQR